MARLADFRFHTFVETENDGINNQRIHPGGILMSMMSTLICINRTYLAGDVHRCHVRANIGLLYLLVIVSRSSSLLVSIILNPAFRWDDSFYYPSVKDVLSVSTSRPHGRSSTDVLQTLRPRRAFCRAVVAAR